MVRPMTLRGQLLALQVLVVLATVVGSGLVATFLQERHVREASRDQMTGVALSVARLPSVVAAFDDADPSATIQPLAEVVREASSMTYVVVTDDEGVRYSHPDPERIGQVVSTDPSEPLSGRVYVGTQTGTLGESWRVKVPVRDAAGAVVGSVSVGVLESTLAAQLRDDLVVLIAWLAASAVLGVGAAALITRLVRRRIFSLEPEQIASMLQTRDAVLHGIREGLVAVDQRGRLAVVNDEAARLLGIEDPDAAGRPAAEVLEPQVLELLAPGEHAEGAREQLVLSGERVLVAHRSTARVDGRHVASVLLLRDRTELRGALRELDGARDITQSLRAQAHEFANQLHVLSGLLELGRHDDAMRFVQRLGSGGPLAPGAPAAHVEDPHAQALLLAKAASSRERGVALVLDPGCALDAGAHGDVLTVLGNLVDNAVDAAGPGGRVDVLVRRVPGAEVAPGTGGGGTVGDDVEVVVDDDGPGVDADQRERVFEVGVSSKEAGGGQGARGFGLALVQRVVRRRRGSVAITASARGGARVRVVLPGAATGGDAAPQSAPQLAPAAAAGAPR